MDDKMTTGNSEVTWADLTPSEQEALRVTTDQLNPDVDITQGVAISLYEKKLTKFSGALTDLGREVLAQTTPPSN